MSQSYFGFVINCKLTIYGKKKKMGTTLRFTNSMVILVADQRVL
jgi:hypothetical protein